VTSTKILLDVRSYLQVFITTPTTYKKDQQKKLQWNEHASYNLNPDQAQNYPPTGIQEEDAMRLTFQLRVKQ